MYSLDEPRPEMEWQMGQPMGAARQRQQADNLPPDQGPHHHDVPEIQFADLDDHQIQALG